LTGGSTRIHGRVVIDGIQQERTQNDSEKAVTSELKKGDNPNSLAVDNDPILDLYRRTRPRLNLKGNFFQVNRSFGIRLHICSTKEGGNSIQCVI